jgi:hypothetical protein
MVKKRKKKQIEKMITEILRATLLLLVVLVVALYSKNFRLVVELFSVIVEELQWSNQPPPLPARACDASDARVRA